MPGFCLFIVGHVSVQRCVVELKLDVYDLSVSVHMDQVLSLVSIIASHVEVHLILTLRSKSIEIILKSTKLILKTCSGGAG